MLLGIPIPKDIVRPPETVLVNITPQETRMVVLGENNICELHIEHNSGHSLVGNIYLGVVKCVLPGMQSVFIDIGSERAAFLHIVDVPEQRRNPDETQRIEHMLFEGQSVLVQVVKDPINAKGVRLSAQTSLADRLLIHLLQEDHIGISQRIEDDAERSNLRERLNSLLPENACHGYIIRINAENASGAQLQSDINYLIKVWEHIQKQAKIQPPEALPYQDLPLSLCILCDMSGLDTHEILIDPTENHRRMTQFAEQYVQGALGRIELFKGGRPLFEIHNIEQEIVRVLQPCINLNFGSYLIIESTEATTTIDVNTGGFVGAHNFDETIFRTNLEACHTIVRGSRPRNLDGIIIIDFVDMAQEVHRGTILQELAKALSLDRTRVTLNGLISLGLVELTHKRSRENLSQILCEPCPFRQGQGRLKTLQTVCYGTQCEIVCKARRYDVQAFCILAASNVTDLFLDEESQSLAMLIDFIGKPVSPAVETAYTQKQYDIALL